MWNYFQPSAFLMNVHSWRLCIRSNVMLFFIRRLWIHLIMLQNHCERPKYSWNGCIIQDGSYLASNIVKNGLSCFFFIIHFSHCPGLLDIFSTATSKNQDEAFCQSCTIVSEINMNKIFGSVSGGKEILHSTLKIFNGLDSTLFS